jgi:tubulin-specific chaperone D
LRNALLLRQDSAWHGGCLALAELARRGLLLPARLGQVVPFVVQALRYDVRKGSASVGAHVRDAACYVCWAFARAYAPTVMEPYMSDLARALILASVYDREINCRRAASAAFQENVGRQGTFPHGIDILTRADYYTLGNRPNAFLEISVYVAQYVEYRYALIDFLVQVQLRHWDRSLRSLSAGTLRLLSKADPAYIVDTVLPALVESTLSADLPTRHGATLAVAECVLGLCDAGRALDDGWHERLVDVVPQIEKARLYRGRGGEVMRGASCRCLRFLMYHTRGRGRGRKGEEEREGERGREGGRERGRERDPSCRQ